MEIRSYIVASILIAYFGNKVQCMCIYYNQRCLLDRRECVHFQALISNEQHLHPNSTIQFFTGTYSLPDNVSVGYILIRDTSNITLFGDPSGSTTIQCDGRLSFTFINVTNLTITDIQFVSCGAPQNLKLIKEQSLSLPEDIQAALFLVNVHSLFMKNVIITYSNGYGLLCFNLFGESQIVGATFTTNHKYRVRSVGGSVLLTFQDGFFYPKVIRVLIIDSHFLHAYSTHDKEYKIPSISGLGIVVKQSSYAVSLVVSHTKFIDNDAPTVAVYTHHPQASYKLLVEESYFGNSIRAGNYDLWNEKAATFMHICSISKSQLDEVANTSAIRTINIRTCTFNGSVDDTYSIGYIDISLLINMSIIIEDSEFFPFITVPAVYVSSEYSRLHTGKSFSILRSNFTGLSYGSISMKSISHTEHLHLVIANCILSNNLFGASTVNIARAYKSYHSPLAFGNKLSVLINGTVFAHNSDISLELGQVNNVTIVNSQFRDNNETAIVCTGSVIYFKGVTSFVGNSGTNGGALSLTPTLKQTLSRNEHWKIKSENVSILYFYPKARLILANNKASNKGGAIYVDTGEPYTGTTYYELCFYQLVGYDLSHFPKIDFINNTAGFAGDSVYGGLDNKCLLQTIQRNKLSFDDFFNISNQLSPSEMAGNPDQVCLCNESVVNCNQRPDNFSLHQGQTLCLFAIATRRRNYHSKVGATPTLISIRIDSAYDAKLGSSQYAQKLDNHCSKVTLTVYSHKPYVLVHLSLGIDQSLSVHQYINLIGCPFGFQLESSMYPGCVCETIVEESECTCSINDLIIGCPVGKWIGNLSNNVIVHNHCPLDYCTSERNITVAFLDDQCNFNHSGILCGKCQPGLSLILGSSKCERCSNTYLLLILPLALAGLSLVFILYSCNLTVSRGTVNGLIYFANVVQVNNSIFIAQHTPRFLTMFLAWVNLDLGLQTCFYNGMDMYAKAWLQFVFPVYMWLIVAAIVFLSRHSVAVSRLTRDNTVPVLATLFLLLYAKLLRAIIIACSFTYLRYPNGTHMPVWMYDGNIPFVKGKHIALFIIALVAVLCFIIPYTLLLLLSPYLQRWSHYKHLRWVNKTQAFLGCESWTIQEQDKELD